jgi:tRNA U34 5-methylaminomethyl-2-thiouridine-forming methyltransferase MnmC
LLIDKQSKTLPQLVLTEDGSHTLFLQELNETYHSTHGAIDESTCVFFNNGLNHFKSKKVINVLEIGFGTGLNSLLAFLYAEKNAINIKYIGIEKFPIPLSLAQTLNYTERLGANEYDQIFNQIHQAASNETIELSSKFSFQKKIMDVSDFESSEKFDIVFFDAFSPDKNPDLWTYKALQKMYQHLKTPGILSTYCAKGSVKRALKEIGFRLEHPPGPKGKREITTAFKDETQSE